MADMERQKFLKTTRVNQIKKKKSKRKKNPKGNPAISIKRDYRTNSSKSNVVNESSIKYSNSERNDCYSSRSEKDNLRNSRQTERSFSRFWEGRQFAGRQCTLFSDDQEHGKFGPTNESRTLFDDDYSTRKPVDSQGHATYYKNRSVNCKYEVDNERLICHKSASRSYENNHRKDDIIDPNIKANDDQHISHKARPKSYDSVVYHKNYRVDHKYEADDDRLSFHKFASKNCENAYNIGHGVESEYATEKEQLISHKLGPKSFESNPDIVTTDLVQNVEYLSNQVNFLSEENNRLNNALCNLRCNWHVLSDADVDIIFKRQDLKEKMLPLLKDLVSDLISGNLPVEELREFYVSAKNKESKQLEEPEGDLFSLDFSALSEPDANSSIPKYETSFCEILQSEEKNKKVNENKESDKRVAKKCFNCSEDHFIYQCPYKINLQKVANAKKRLKTFVPNVRYHVRGQNECGFKPGVISDELREALNLQENEIPRYIYHMRILNYPPGWLNEAAVESSGITVYDSHGNAEKDNGEEGEVDTTCVKVQYDPDKLIDYPGFNVPLSPDIIDRSDILGYPPLQTHHLRCIVEKSMVKPDVLPQRKRKLKLPDPSVSLSKRERLEEDMEVDENLDSGIIEENVEGMFIPPLPSDAPPPPPPDDSADSSDATYAKSMISHSDVSSDYHESSSTFRAESVVERFKVKSVEGSFSGKSSPSLTELEEMKLRLVMELGLSGSETQDTVFLNSECLNDADQGVNSEVETSSCLDDTFVTLESSNGVLSFSDCSVTSMAAENKDFADGSASPSLESNEHKTSMSKFMTLGTPSLSKHSPFSKLPEYDQFSKNVTSHLNFENLPNSTGTYEKMKNVLKKVKQKLKSII